MADLALFDDCHTSNQPGIDFIFLLFYFFFRKSFQNLYFIGFTKYPNIVSYIFAMIVLLLFANFLSLNHFYDKTIHKIEVTDSQVLVSLRSKKVDVYEKSQILLISYERYGERSSFGNKFTPILTIYTKNKKNVYDLTFHTNDTLDYISRLSNELSGKD